MKKKIVLLSIFLLTISTLLIVKSKNVIAYTGADKLKNYQQVDTEFRGVWVATVYNLDMKKQKGTNAEAINEWKNRYLTILDTAKANNLNAIIFQIRPCNDAFYPSEYNPWSEYLCGYGVNPGWDPLEWMIEVTHEYGLEYHAWLNPYRATVSSNVSIIEKSGTIRNVVDYDDQKLQADKKSVFGSLKNRAGKTPSGSDYQNPVFSEGKQLEHNVVLGAEDKYVLNPAASETIEHLENTIEEIITNYNIDGIHFDDYFYPYTATYSSIGTVKEYKGLSFSTEPKIDYADYQAYKTAGGELSLYNWRRENVNKLISNLSKLVRDKNAQKETPCAFGISPAARWAPSLEACSANPERGAEGGMSGSCNNYYSYSDLYADTKKWVDEEWIDYILPQAYTKLGSGYEEIVRWWSEAVKNSKTKLYIGTATYQLDSWNDVSEVYYQIRYNQSEKLNVSGYVMYDYTSLTKGKGKIGINLVTRGCFKNDALTPIYSTYNYKNTVEELSTIKKIIASEENAYDVLVEKVNDAKAYAIYQFDDIESIKTENCLASNMVAMNLNSDDALSIKKYDETKIYVLATISKSNTIYIGETIDFTKNINHVPTVTITDLKSEYLLNDSVNFNITIDDVDKDILDVKVYAVIGKNEQMIRSNQFESGIIKINWNHNISTDTNGISIKVVVNDGFNEVTYTSEKFKLVEYCSQHSFEPADCTTPKTCSLCGYEEGEPLGHDLEHHEGKDATCTSAGYEEYDTCKRCDYTTYQEIPARGHEWVDATTEAPKTCTRCKETVGEKLPTEKKNCKNKKTILTIVSLVSLSMTLITIKRKEY